MMYLVGLVGRLKRLSLDRDRRATNLLYWLSVLLGSMLLTILDDALVYERRSLLADTKLKPRKTLI